MKYYLLHMISKLGVVGVVLVFIFPSLVVVIIILSIRYDEVNKTLIRLERKNSVLCTQVDEYFNKKGNERSFSKLDLFPYLSRARSRFAIYSFNLVTGSEDETRIVYAQDLPEEYSFDLSDRPFVGIGNKFFVLSQEMCSYGEGICKQDLYVHHNDNLGVKGEVVLVPKEFRPQIERKVQIMPLAIGVEKNDILILEMEKSVHLRSLEGVVGTSIIFSLSKGNKLISFDTSTGKWEDYNGPSFHKIRSIDDIFKNHQCAYFVSSRGPYIFLKEGYVSLVNK